MFKVITIVLLIKKTVIQVFLEISFKTYMYANATNERSIVHIPIQTFILIVLISGALKLPITSKLKNKSANFNANYQP